MYYIKNRIKYVSQRIVAVSATSRICAYLIRYIKLN